jgi:hypothetical protein
VEKKKIFRSTHLFFFIGVVAFSTFYFNYRINPGADIEIGRNHLIEGNGNNLLGSFASFFYYNVPDFIFPWQLNLLLLQVLLSALGFICLFLRSNIKPTPKTLILGLLLANILLMFSTEQSRDGTMLAFLTFSLGLGVFASKENVIYKKRLLYFISACAFVIGFSFRPWLTFATVPLFYFVNKKARFNPRIILASIVLMILPTGIENAVTKYKDMANWFPQQTVMIHDLSSTFCWSNELEIRERAWDGLSVLKNNDLAKTELCQAFKPNTWQSVVGVGNSTQSGIPPLRTIDSDNYTEYSKIQDAWLKTIKMDPLGYIQNHLMFSTQVLIAGEMRSISMLSLNELELYSLMKSLWLLPIEIIKSFHLASPLAIFLFYWFFRRKYLSERARHELSDVFLMILIFWIAITSMGYVSDNGRYTLLPAILLVLLSFKELSPLKPLDKGD